MEAAYLARKAGYETVVIDRREDAPALSLCDVPVVLDPITTPDEAVRCFNDCDAVIPASENMDLLWSLQRTMEDTEVPFLFDMSSYLTSSSKNKSNEIMNNIGIPIPRDYPECGYPAVVKPSSQSGSIGVTVVNSPEEASAAFSMIEKMGDDIVAQEFVSGKGVSIEVIGNGSKYTSFATTEIILDRGYDCKRVICTPEILDADTDRELNRIGTDIAGALELKGLMDVEAILTKNGLRVLEIDARIPSQTPAAVLAATGINILKELVDRMLGKDSNSKAMRGSSSYEHFVVRDGVMMTCGEKEFSHVSGPKITKGLFGSDEMISDFSSDKKEWRGTMINSGRTAEDMECKRVACIRRIMDECDVVEFVDSAPEVV